MNVPTVLFRAVSNSIDMPMVLPGQQQGPNDAVANGAFTRRG
jgi:hypothetical protein